MYPHTNTMEFEHAERDIPESLKIYVWLFRFQERNNQREVSS